LRRNLFAFDRKSGKIEWKRRPDPSIADFMVSVAVNIRSTTSVLRLYSIVIPTFAISHASAQKTTLCKTLTLISPLLA
jgi:hypothetical protein